MRTAIPLEQGLGELGNVLYKQVVKDAIGRKHDDIALDERV